MNNPIAFSESTINSYLNKWEQVALSTEPIMSILAKDLVLELYKLIKHNYPGSLNKSPEQIEVVLVDTPFEAFPLILDNICNSRRGIVEPQLSKRVSYQLYCQLDIEIQALSRVKLYQQLQSQLENSLYNQFWKKLQNTVDKYENFDDIYSGFYRYFQEEHILWPALCCWLDFCINELDCQYSNSEWLLFQSVAKLCGWTFLFKNMAIVCQRPGEIVKHEQGYWTNWNIDHEIKSLQQLL